MSTNERYGTAVWDAVVYLDNDAWRTGLHCWTAGEVAKVAGVSRPTAKKYLQLLVDMNKMWATVTGAKVTLYAVTMSAMEEVGR